MRDRERERDRGCTRERERDRKIDRERGCKRERERERERIINMKNDGNQANFS